VTKRLEWLGFALYAALAIGCAETTFGTDGKRYRGPNAAVEASASRELGCPVTSLKIVNVSSLDLPEFVVDGCGKHAIYRSVEDGALLSHLVRLKPGEGAPIR
jgi:hypothetical protein